MRRFLNSLELPGVEMVAAAAAATAEVPDQRKPREFADLLKMEIFFCFRSPPSVFYAGRFSTRFMGSEIPAKSFVFIIPRFSRASPELALSEFITLLITRICVRSGVANANAEAEAAEAPKTSPLSDNLVRRSLLYRARVRVLRVCRKRVLTHLG